MLETRRRHDDLEDMLQCGTIFLMLLKPNGPISVSRQKISTAEGTGDLASSSVDDARAQAWRDRPFRCHGDLDDAKPMATMRQTVHSWRIARLKIPRAGKNEDEQEMGDNSMDCAAVELRYARRPRLVFTGLERHKQQEYQQHGNYHLGRKQSVTRGLIP